MTEGSKMEKKLVKVSGETHDLLLNHKAETGVPAGILIDRLVAEYFGLREPVGGLVPEKSKMRFLELEPVEDE